MNKFIIVLILNLSFQLFGQQTIDLCGLNDSIDESSGLLYLNGKLITHNDSGNQAALYEIDSLTGAVNRTVIIENASNVDWEDLAFDDTYIYIGDFGNNNGNRTDLKIYRCLITDYFSSLNDTISADTIFFSYADQVDFTSSPLNTNYDAEAFICMGDSLYIFTKNWVDSKTNIYSLSNNPGTHSAIKIDSIDSQGLVAGASINPSLDQIILCGYATINPFIITINQFTNSQFSNGQVNRYNLPLAGSSQSEGITSLSQSQHYISTEINFTGAATLHRLSLTGFAEAAGKEFAAVQVFPNPTIDKIQIASDGDWYAELYDFNLKLLISTIEKSIDISHLNEGIYLLKLSSANQETIKIQKIVIQ